MTDRYRAKSLQPVKRMIASGNYLQATEVLLARRSSLLFALHHQDNGRAIERVELLLTLVNCLLAECASKAGDNNAAHKWFDTAFSYCMDSHDPIVHLRLNRVYALHLADLGQLDQALTEITSVIGGLRRLTSDDTVVPIGRRKVEIAYSTSCQARILLMQDPASETGRKLALQSRKVLRSGTKRRYELQNLLLCLDGTNCLAQPVSWQRMITRAMYLNEVHVQSHDIRQRLVAVSLTSPFSDGLAFGRAALSFVSSR